jgi:hypothetical protein
MRHFEIPDVEADENIQTKNYTDTDGGALSSLNRRSSNALSTDRDEMRNFESQLNFFQNVFGSRFDGGRLDGDVLHLLDEASIFGPQQIASYSRESSKSASGCCPYGCCEERVREMNIDKLSQLEHLMALRAEETYQDLKNLQTKYVMKSVDATEDARIQHSSHSNAENLNLRKGAHRLSRLSNRTHKVYPPQINVPDKVSDNEKTIMVSSDPLFSFSGSVRYD